MERHIVCKNSDIEHTYANQINIGTERNIELRIEILRFFSWFDSFSFRTWSIGIFVSLRIQTKNPDYKQRYWWIGALKIPREK